MYIVIYIFSFQESRVSLRLLLLQCFGALCGLHGDVISELLNSVLPLELARDIQTDTQGTLEPPTFSNAKSPQHKSWFRRVLENWGSP